MSTHHQSERLAALIADGNGPILVSFHDDACDKGACGVQNGYVDRLASNLQGSAARFEQVSLDASPELVEKYQITSLPSAILFVDGQIETRLSGLTDPGVLACTILSHVEAGTEWMAASGNICPLPSAAA